MKILIVLVSSLFTTGCNEQIPLPRLSEDAVILAFGDSLTYGTGASNKNDYPSILSELTSLTVINGGIPGEISKNGLVRLPALLDTHQPELLILIHGGNDILRQVSHKETAKNLGQMIQEARKRNISVIMLGVPKPGLFFLKSAEVYVNIAKEYQTPAGLEVLPKVLGDNSLKSDPIHPNDDGYQLIAERIFELLQETGAI